MPTQSNVKLRAAKICKPCKVSGRRVQSGLGSAFTKWRTPIKQSMKIHPPNAGLGYACSVLGRHQCAAVSARHSRALGKGSEADPMNKVFYRLLTDPVAQCGRAAASRMGRGTYARSVETRP